MAQDNSGNGLSDDHNVMDYPEHERTYEMFLVGSKWLVIISCAVLIAMAFGFFAGGGFFGGFVAFVILLIAGAVLG